jgi:hypothetical protein
MPSHLNVILPGRTVQLRAGRSVVDREVAEHWIVKRFVEYREEDAA